jgi:hypothetical protein
MSHIDAPDTPVSAAGDAKAPIYDVEDPIAVTYCGTSTEDLLALPFAWLALPFEMAREQYSKVVQSGALPNSMLAAQRFTMGLDALEKMTLGPFARHC